MNPRPLTTAPGVHIITLGCPKNEADSRTLTRRLASEGIRVVEEPLEASHVLLNTCGFIEDARKESIGAILEAAAAYPTARLHVMGCLVERYRAELEEGLPEVHGWYGLTELGALTAILQAEAGAAVGRESDAVGSVIPASDQTSSGSGPLSAHAYVKISDGCDHLCSFCAIPNIKGPYHSLAPDEVIEQVEGALDTGARELVLVGQDTTLWHADGMDLLDLVALISEDERVLRVRLMYLQPEHVDDRFLTAMAGYPKLCRYLDIPFQHAHRDILRAMGRRGDATAYLRLLERARSIMPDVSVRSTFIVGFPGETEEHVEALADFMRAARFDHAGAFAFSAEEGTPAATLSKRPSARVVRQRMSYVSAILAESAEHACRARLGERVEVLIDAPADADTPEGTVAIGRTRAQAPDVDGVTYLVGQPPPRAAVGDRVQAVVVEAIGHDLVAEPDAIEPA